MSTIEEIKNKTMSLFARMHDTDSSEKRIYFRNEIVTLNMPLVTMVLKKYKPYTEDQFQVGCIGLIKATDTYEISREVPFHNYACFVIERELHMDYNRRMDSIEEKMKEQLVCLDVTTTMPNGDEVETYNLIEDPEAIKELEDFIEENQLRYLCENVIKPSIHGIAEKGRNAKSKVDFDVWEQLEFRYIMSIIFEESQKRRFNLTQMSKECGISLPNIRNRHVRVMDIIFQRMWSYMTLPYSDLLDRIRGNHKIPERLLCLDPGKTTGWCLFVDGKLQSWGQVEDCYDDDNINIQGMMDLFQAVKPTFICYEDYRVYSHKLDRHSYSPVMTVRLIGMVETYCQMNNIKTHKQMASTAKTFCTDEKMKSWGFWQEGMRHARDAIRHGCYFLLFYKKGQDII